MKKTFIILNGKTLRIVERDSMAAAITSARNTCDHSHEIIVREIDYNLFVDHAREYIDQPTTPTGHQ